ncbi:ABC transporter permease [Pseudoalteromonas sp. DY56-GL79]|uniref:ABC transporter permease n=1 Tax=Pseudoalteromonas sp. DY56-GL79 TaxID=2967131 RepID=UPI00352A4FAB
MAQGTVVNAQESKELCLNLSMAIGSSKLESASITSRIFKPFTIGYFIFNFVCLVMGFTVITLSILITQSTEVFIFQLLGVGFSGVVLIVILLNSLCTNLVYVKSRAREMTIRKILGATQVDFISLLLLESVPFTFLAGLVSLVFIECFALYFSVFTLGLTIQTYSVSTICCLLFIMFSVVFISNTYPAILAASVDYSRVLATKYSYPVLQSRIANIVFLIQSVTVSCITVIMVYGWEYIAKDVQLKTFEHLIKQSILLLMVIAYASILNMLLSLIAHKKVEVAAHKLAGASCQKIVNLTVRNFFKTCHPRWGIYFLIICWLLITLLFGLDLHYGRWLLFSIFAILSFIALAWLCIVAFCCYGYYQKREF